MDRLGRGYGGPASQAPAYGNRSQPFATLPPRSPPYPNRPFSRPTDTPETKPDRLSPPRGPKTDATSAPSIRPVESPHPANIGREKEIPRAPGYRARELANQTPTADENRVPKSISSEVPEAPSGDKVQSRSPPPGPSASKRGEPAARGGHAALLSAPTRPKGASGPHFNRDTAPRDSPRGGGSVRRPSHGPPYPGPSSGGRGGPSPSPSYDSHRPGPYRHSNSSSTTYPRTQRFTSYLSGLPTIIPGGKLLPSGLDPSFEKRIAQLEADKERLLLQIADKQKSKRTSLKEWDKLSRESSTATLRSELAEGHLQRITEGDDIGGGAAF